jgi:hypothetical protein
VLNGKRVRPDSPHATRNVLPRIVRQVEPAKLGLDGDLPRTGRRKEELIGGILQGAEVLAETFRLGQQPKEDVRVEEELHPSALEPLEDVVLEGRVEVLDAYAPGVRSLNWAPSGSVTVARRP